MALTLSSDFLECPYYRMFSLAYSRLCINNGNESGLRTTALCSTRPEGANPCVRSTGRSVPKGHELLWFINCQYWRQSNTIRNVILSTSPVVIERSEES
jgi:hypothetical protein